MMILDAEHYVAGFERIACEAEQRVRNWVYDNDGTDEALKERIRAILEDRR